MSTTTDKAPPQTPPAPAQVLLHDIAEEAPLRDPVRRRRLLLGIGVAVVALALVLATLRLVGVVGAPSEADKDAEALVTVQEQVRPALDDLMSSRAVFFDAERRYLPAMKQAETRAQAYNRRYLSGQRRTAVPDFSGPAGELDQVADELTALGKQLREVRPEAGVTSDAHDYLINAVRTLARDARRNAAVLQRSRGPFVLVAVDDDNALNSIRRMNKSLLFVLDATQLPIREFDLPGGTDPHRDDHSNLI
ncbi:hypothetical protein Kisp01_25900 [Kineosporia sp. NBRC 101677]|uniref:hypothetical protein n=1 Tax=Kineosporia sp. NBRC 101677 TaxID=3032197 RepID=UPI0024A120D4|nr:hypothetical protein [Kineosporia sp. NBRC 101677]GLY15575.1 hypothetical protein Kisp01_25900 [Kineosporia sp. NBRC 101677]